VILKIVPTAGYECTLEKIDPMRSKESLNRNLLRLLEKLLELESVLKESSKKFIVIFFKTKQGKNL
jgi:hypothetical protein